jgi:hypothetical protein
LKLFFRPLRKSKANEDDWELREEEYTWMQGTRMFKKERKNYQGRKKPLLEKNIDQIIAEEYRNVFPVTSSTNGQQKSKAMNMQCVYCGVDYTPPWDMNHAWDCDLAPTYEIANAMWAIGRYDEWYRNRYLPARELFNDLTMELSSPDEILMEGKVSCWK